MHQLSKCEVIFARALRNSQVADNLTGKTVAIQMSGGNASGTELQQAMALPCLLDGAC
jgi:hypothetical protein